MRLVSVLATLSLLFGFGETAMAAEAVVKVSALSSGKLLLEGQPTTLSALDAVFAALQKSHGVVWYYREDAASAEPPPAAMEVIKLVIKHRLPISMPLQLNT